MLSKIVKIEKIEDEDRYDFEVEDISNFFYNGVLVHNCRGVSINHDLFSRNGEAIVSVPHITEELKKYFPSKYVYDGELYSHEYKDDFDTIMSNTKKLKPTPEDLEESKSIIEYHIYDIYCSESSGMLFEDRLEFLHLLFKNIPQDSCLKLVTTHKVGDTRELKVLYDYYLDEGYEGQIVRSNAPYVNKRTDTLLKRKEWTDSEFELISFEEGKGNWKNKAKKAWFKIPSDWPVIPGAERVFKASVKGPMGYCEELLKNKDKYVGKLCTVTYCPQLTPDGIPRFARVKELDRKDL